MRKMFIMFGLFISLSIFPTFSFASTDCFTAQKVKWDGVELKAGQIGRVIIQKPTSIYKNVNGTFEFWKAVKPGESYRIYANKATYFHLGAGLVIHNDASILYETPSKDKLSTLNCNKNFHTTFTIGDSINTATSKIGNAKKELDSEHNSSTSIHHNNYEKFYAISHINNKITSIYTKDKNYQFNGISVTDTISILEKKLGTNYETIGNTYPIEIITYHFSRFDAHFFIDVHTDNRVSAILLVDHELVEDSSKLSSKNMNILQSSYESLLFEITNAERKVQGVYTLKYSTSISNVARKHSVDMGKNDYFNHDNLKGESPFDRLSIGGVLFRNAGENIAMGYTNPYFAHEALMNSPGHRKNIISTDFTEHGTGVYFATFAQGFVPYYTENFIKP